MCVRVALIDCVAIPSRHMTGKWRRLQDKTRTYRDEIAGAVSKRISNGNKNNRKCIWHKAAQTLKGMGLPGAM